MKKRDRDIDAIVIGAGPNGLAAAIVLAEAGWDVRVYETAEVVGGGVRSAELTLPGFVHDIGSAIHPLTLASPFFSRLPLDRLGLEWVYSPAALAHPFDDGHAALLWQSITDTATGLGPDGTAWQELFQPFTNGVDDLLPALLGPLRLPSHPLQLAGFGMLALHSATSVATTRFCGQDARALFAGMAAHSTLSLEQLGTAAFGLVLGTAAHAVSWPFPRGGAQQIADALAGYLRLLGGEIVTGHTVRSIDELPAARAYLFDTSPRAMSRIAGAQLPDRYHRQLSRYRHGPGVVKVDYALAGPVPWTAAACNEAATVHLGGTLAEIVAAERDVMHGGHPERPYVLAAQHSLFDPTRAPAGQHTLWAYTHVPNGSTLDISDRIDAQFERFAPGFRDLILERHVMLPADIERYDANFVGGDINVGSQDLRQLFTRPTPRVSPYTTPNPRIFLCSSATPPGGGVHGMCGYHAARAVLRG